MARSCRLGFYNSVSKALDVAQYFYNNTNVETANSTYKSSASSNTFSVISTYHSDSGSPLDPKRYVNNFSVNGDLFYSSILTSQDHNHPIGLDVEPSGLQYDSRTKAFVKSTNIFAAQKGALLDTDAARNNPNIKLRVYSSALKQYINYNETSGHFEK